jgi:hypothetical protein
MKQIHPNHCPEAASAKPKGPQRMASVKFHDIAMAFSGLQANGA